MDIHAQNKRRDTGTKDVATGVRLAVLICRGDAVVI